QVTVLSERRKTQPYGLQGGKPGSTGRNLIITGDQEIEMPSKFNKYLGAGESIRIETPGGGGFEEDDE
ncbi:MAG: hydantoinase B/oxoprolinase family protein, partial [Candidatus Marinimicrobia bacterium]|nr:hydantoinase B/oxoprolinase family protein [Candidatus Neomarinimicrobiota bacterium]